MTCETKEESGVDTIDAKSSGTAENTPAHEGEWGYETAPAHDGWPADELSH